MATDAQVVSTVRNELTWLQRHERIILLSLVLLFGGYAVNKYTDLTAARADAKNVIAQQQVVDAKANAAAALLQASQTAAQYQALVSVITERDAALAQAVAQRNVVLTQTQAVVHTAPLPDVVLAWQKQVPVGSIVSDTKGVILDETAARETVSQLVELPVAKADLTDQKEISANLQSAFDESSKNLAAKDVVISALNTEIKTQDTACKAEVAAVKAEGKKNSVKWFKRGFIVGFVAGLWTGHAAGI